MTKQRKLNSFLSYLLAVLLLAAMLLTAVSCDKTNEAPESDVPTEDLPAVSFTFEVVFEDKTTKSYNITTQKRTIGEVLVDEGLIDGEEGPYGLYVKTVCGETHVYEEDGKYWAFYINGEYGMTGVDKTNVEDGATYSFKAE